MANTGIRQLTTVVGGYAKRIWYSLNGTTPTAELMSIDDTGKFKCVSEQVTGLAGIGPRVVIADASGNLSTISRLATVNFTGLTTDFQRIVDLNFIGAAKFLWTFTSSTGATAVIESTHNLYPGVNVLSQFSGCTVTEVIPNASYSFRLGDSIVEIKIETGTGLIYLKRNSGTVTDLTIERITQNI